jgi:protoheme ferro-lyase
LADGQKDLAKQYAGKALALLDAHKLPASSWTDTDEYRAEVRRSTEKTLKKLTPSEN